jgi:hypothetical protein
MVSLSIVVVKFILLLCVKLAGILAFVFESLQVTSHQLRFRLRAFLNIEHVTDYRQANFVLNQVRTS